MVEKLRLDIFWKQYKAKQFKNDAEKIQWLLLVIGNIVITQPTALIDNAITYANEKLESFEEAFSKYIN